MAVDADFSRRSEMLRNMIYSLLYYMIHLATNLIDRNIM